MSRNTVISILAGAALLAGADAAAESPLLALPESPSWQHSRAFVDAYNSGDSGALSRYFTTRLSERASAQQPALWRAAAIQRLRREVGAVEVVEVSGLSHVLVLNARTRDGGNVDVVLLVSADDPSRIDELRVIRDADADVALGEAP